MTVLGQRFRTALGEPNPATPDGLNFRHLNSRVLWQQLHREIGSGWYSNRFLYLFGEGLETLQPCLDAWSFLLEPNRERMIVGRNAYGALLVAENPTIQGFVCPIYVLDPLNVRYWTRPNLDFSGLIGYWLPEAKLGDFLDQRLYDAWVKVTGDCLELDEVLAIKEPLSLGGKMEAINFQIESIVEYYRTTGPIYAKAFRQTDS